MLVRAAEGKAGPRCVGSHLDLLSEEPGAGVCARPPPRRCWGDAMTDFQCFLVCMVTDVYVNNRPLYEGIHFIAKY